MALLFIESFDYIENGFTKWGAKISGPVVDGGTKRSGVSSVQCQNGEGLTSKVYTTSGGVVLGVAVYLEGVPAADFILVLESAITHIAVATTAGGLLQVKRGTTVLATGTTVLTAGGWYYIELKALIHDTTGAYEVRIDGIPEAALTASGVDTRNAGTGVWDRVTIKSGVSSTYFDDFYLCDTSGSAPRNDFLGTIKVETLLPQTDAVAAGSNAGLTPSTGTDHGALVDETPPNTTDYNSGATVGLKDTYNYPPMATTGTIYGIQTNLYAAKSDAAARQVCAVVRAGGTDYDGANVSPSTTFGYFSEIRPQNPNTSAEWTTADIASLQAGMKVTV